ncbi:hypothetical protein [Leptospira sp. 'Mane']|uniref:hypothetical protein n=1 Tax=Leptospira sp. 'Mane' TaxID=3387407 RepID=UPI00398BAB06
MKVLKKKIGDVLQMHCYSLTVLLSFTLSCTLVSENKNETPNQSLLVILFSSPTSQHSSAEITNSTNEDGATFPPGSLPSDNPGDCGNSCTELVYEEKAGDPPPLPLGSLVDKEISLLNGRIKAFIPASPFNTRIKVTDTQPGNYIYYYYDRYANIKAGSTYGYCYHEYDPLLTDQDFPSDCMQNTNYLEKSAPPFGTYVYVFDDKDGYEEFIITYDLDNLGKYNAGSDHPKLLFKFFKQPTPLNPYIVIASKDNRYITRVFMTYQKFDGTEYKHFCSQEFSYLGKTLTRIHAKATACEVNIRSLTAPDLKKLRVHLEVHTLKLVAGVGKLSFQSAIYYFPDL